MRYRPLGETGLLVSELCLGTMTFGGSGRPGGELIGDLQVDDAEALLRQACDAGVNLIDTANVYGLGRSEEIVGEAIRRVGLGRDEFVLATKVMASMGKGPNQGGLTRYHIAEAAKASLRRLQLDHIDLYQFHGFDPGTPVDESLEAIDLLVRQGLVRYVGVSNWAAWQIVEALGKSDNRGLAKFASIQAYYSLAGRDIEREIVPMLQSKKLGLLVWSPLAGGLLTGKFDGRSSKQSGRRSKLEFPPVDRSRAEAVIEAMRVIALDRGVPVAAIALAWLLHQPAVSSVIVGATSAGQLRDNIASIGITLTPEELGLLDQVSRLPAEYPGWMLEVQAGYRPQSGGTG